MRAVSLLSILSLALSGTPLWAQPSPAVQLQAPSGERGWSLTAQARRATVNSEDGARQRFRLLRGETPLRMIELGDGSWFASGVRVTDDGVRLSLLDASNGRVRRLVPPASEAAHRTGPVAISGPDGLAGLVWLEGDELGKLSVMAAEWVEGGWSRAELVSRPGLGSQTGLTATARSDGSWIVAWARYDGNDDEIYWATRHADGTWSRARALDPVGNRVPDALPRLTESNGEVLIAWNRQINSEYWVVTATLGESVWSSARRVGDVGAIFPQFRRVGGKAYLLAQDSWPQGWRVFELGTSGRAEMFATSPSDGLEGNLSIVPILRDLGGRGLALVWPGARNTVSLEWEVVR